MSLRPCTCGMDSDGGKDCPAHGSALRSPGPLAVRPAIIDETWKPTHWHPITEESGKCTACKDIKALRLEVMRLRGWLRIVEKVDWQCARLAQNALDGEEIPQ